MTNYVPLVEVTRGEATESVHFGAVAVVDLGGHLLASAGHPHCVTFTRSSLKPFQAMPFVAQGGVEAFGFTQEELAVLCASHNGEDLHLEAVTSILRKIGLSESDLQCGSHVPNYLSERGERVVGKADFSPKYNNCSGKHAGMLAFCRLLDVSHSDYLQPGHPIQKAIKKSTAHFTGVPESDLLVGTDGCSAPNYALPLSGLALAFARLSSRDPDPEYGAAPAQVFGAMTAHPRMGSGLGRGDLAIMQAGCGDWVSKVGGEAVKGVGIRSRGIGIAAKVAGGGTRALVPLIVEVLRQLDILPSADGTPLETWARPEVKNHRDIVTGYIVPKFELKRMGVARKGERSAAGTL